jgi:hypothetical protein
LRAYRRPHPEEARSAVSKDEATELEDARANHSGAKTQHPRQMLRILRSSSLSRSPTVALSSRLSSRSRTVSLAPRRDLAVAYRVRLILSARCTHPSARHLRNRLRVLHGSVILFRLATACDPGYPRQRVSAPYYGSEWMAMDVTGRPRERPSAIPARAGDSGLHTSTTPSFAAAAKAAGR